MKKTDYILPVGFYDLINSEAKKNEEIIQIIKNSFEKEQFNLIKTPLLEFDDKIDDNSFKTMDILSKKFLKIRNDITPQIIRLVKTKFSNQNDQLKLSYIGDILKSENRELFYERQLTQAGIEIISPTIKDSNFYILDTILNILKQLNLKNNLISFSIPGILTRLIDKLEISQPEKLKESIENKDVEKIKQYSGKYTNIILKITLESFDQSILSEEIIQSEKESIQKILQIKSQIENKYPDSKIDIDIFDSNFSFQENFGFMIFTKNFKYPIARGGEYKIDDKNAIGGSIYVNHILKQF
jgi:ATP phosphoribosyltransferase regulatory subunit HisZ|tara:strand:- start:38056 stop:38952 length:897 start_codon:yes stop_codon:yes gene_type:complete